MGLIMNVPRRRGTQFNSASWFEVLAAAGAEDQLWQVGPPKFHHETSS